MITLFHVLYMFIGGAFFVLALLCLYHLFLSAKSQRIVKLYTSETLDERLIPLTWFKRTAILGAVFVCLILVKLLFKL